MERDEFKCLDCGDSDNTLNVHHLYYVKDRILWDYPNHAMVTLCEPCHKHRHANPDIRTMWERVTELLALEGGRNGIPVVDALEHVGFAIHRAKRHGIPYKEALERIKSFCDKSFLDTKAKPKRRKGKAK